MEIVHDSGQADVQFPDGPSWRRYVFSLPRRKACDMIDWTWTQKVQKGGRFWILTAMNISILLNGGQDAEEININPKEAASSKIYATRDIQKDKELLTDYTIYDTVWGRVGL